MEKHLLYLAKIFLNKIEACDTNENYLKTKKEKL